MTEFISATGELLKIRYGPMLGFAVLSILTVLIIWGIRLLLVRTRVIPAVTNPSRRSLRTDLVYLITAPVTEVFSRTAMVFALILAAWIGGHHLSPQLFSGFGPVIEQPRWLIIGEVLIFPDFVYYWVHRAAHTFPALWRFHAVHHSTEHLRWTSALRAHPVEVYLHVVIALPLFLVGFPLDVLAGILAVSGFYSFWIHTNVNIAPGRLRYVLNSPRFHAWHHQRDVKDGTVNYGAFFPLFDALFGTFKLPDRLPPDFGLDDPTTLKVPEDFLGQLRYPFRRLKQSPAEPTSVAGSVAPCPETEH